MSQPQQGGPGVALGGRRGLHMGEAWKCECLQRGLEPGHDHGLPSAAWTPACGFPCSREQAAGGKAANQKRVTGAQQQQMAVEKGKAHLHFEGGGGAASGRAPGQQASG